MKKGIHYWALPTSFTLEEKFKFAKRCGFDGVELVILKDQGLSMKMSDKALSEVRNIAECEGVAIPSLTNTLSWNCSFTSADPEIRQLAYETLKREIDIAYALGVPAVLALPGFVSFPRDVNGLHPSTITSGKEEYTPAQEIVPYDLAYERSLEGLSAIAAYAKEAEVTVCVENIWSSFLLSPLEMRGFIDSIASDYIKSYFDVGNVMPFGYPDQWIRILGNRIRRVHIKDYKDGGWSMDRFCNLGEGNIDFESVVLALKAIDYDGWVTAEVNVDVDNPERVAMEASRQMDLMFHKEELI